jgi:hypothetical protein
LIFSSFWLYKFVKIKPFHRLSFHRVMAGVLLVHNYFGAETCKPLLASGGISRHGGTML